MPLNLVDGISSGLNTTEIIDSIISFERQNAVLFENQVEDKTNQVSTLKALQAKFVALSTEILKLTRRSTFEISTVNVSDETKLSASSTGKIGSGSYNVQILALARNQQIASQGISSESAAEFGIGTIAIQVGDGSIQNLTIDSSNNSLVGIKNAINNAKLGVTASIINDGSSSNPYRLIISANKTGLANKINITSSLTGGTDLDFVNSSFDAPETVSFNSGSDSQITLGGAAAYTGSQNKVYTFTVQGSGAQTIGTDTIDVNWTDGTNSGTIQVSTADTEVTLTGTGADGLTLSFSSGTLTAGDTFQVSTFSPLLQDAADAKINLGSTGGSGSPITVSSATNTFKDVIAGLEFTVYDTTDSGKSVTINTALDTTGVRSAVNEFIKRYNEVNDFIDEQNKFNQDTGESGFLFGDLTIQTLQNSLRRTLSNVVGGLDSQFNQLYSIGIRTLGTGRLSIANASRFEDALKNNLEDVIKLFTNSASSSSSFIEFMSATAETESGTSFNVDITQAASKGKFTGVNFTDLASTPIVLTSANNRLKFNIDGAESSEIILTEKSYESTTELINEIQEKIAADDKIGTRNSKVKWVSTGSGTGHIEISSNSYGKTSKVELVTSISNSAFSILGLTSGTATQGLDVAGTINGEAAQGAGQILTGKEGNEKTDGLKLKITLDDTQLVDGFDGTINVTKGLASRLNERVDSIIAVGEGTFDRKIKSVESQITELNKRVSDIDERLKIRRQTLTEQFIEMETALGELNSQGNFLSGQLNLINSNWSAIRGSRSNN